MGNICSNNPENLEDPHAHLKIRQNKKDRSSPILITKGDGKGEDHLEKDSKPEIVKPNGLVMEEQPIIVNDLIIIGSSNPETLNNGIILSKQKDEQFEEQVLFTATAVEEVEEVV